MTPITKIQAAGIAAWAQATAIRAVRSAAQAALVVLGGDMVDAWSADWERVAGASVGMAVVSVLTSIAFPPPEAEKK